MNPRRTDSRTLVFGATLCGEAPPEALRLDVVDERALAVDLDDREQLAVPRLELVVIRDVDLAQIEVELGAQLRQLGPSPLAEVAAGRVEEHHFRTVGTVPAVSARHCRSGHRGQSPLSFRDRGRA